MSRVNIYIRPHQKKTLKKMDKLRGTLSKSEFILKSVEYMIDTHEKNKDILSPIDLPNLADDVEIWKIYFQGMQLTNLVDAITKLEKLQNLARMEVADR
jgi:hypothetical protein|tara:strand:- start:10400 stop:10696 length:297 start_codon:yes stop_codon:yes gene_type:complete